jgi:hypothetical protein
MKRLVKGLLQNPGAASLALFTREIWANPRAMGAACPSTPALASSMASRVPLDREGLVVYVFLHREEISDCYYRLDLWIT